MVQRPQAASPTKECYCLSRPVQYMDLKSMGCNLAPDFVVSNIHPPVLSNNAVASTDALSLSGCIEM